MNRRSRNPSFAGRLLFLLLALPAATASKAQGTPVLDLAAYLTTDTTGTVEAGATIHYTARFANVGQSSVNNARFSFTFQTSQLTCSWTCTEATGLACPAPASGTQPIVTQLPYFATGNALTYQATCTVNDTATGNIVVSAAIAAPPDWFETAVANNYSPSTITLRYADLGIRVRSDTYSALPGATARYEIEARNFGTIDAADVHVVNDFPAGAQCSWQCYATCPASQGQGDIDMLVSLPATIETGRSIFLATCVLPSSGLSFVNTATVAGATGFRDATASNNLETTTITTAAFVDLLAENGHQVAPPVLVGDAIRGNSRPQFSFRNNSTSGANARIEMQTSAQLANVEVTCTASAPSSTCTVRREGDRWIAEAGLPPYQLAFVYVTGDVAAGADEFVEIAGTASVVAGSDADPTNNTMSYRLPVSMFYDHFGPRY